MSEMAETNQPAEKNDEENPARRPVEPRGAQSSHLEIIGGDKISGDKVGRDKITIGGDYIARQVIVQETRVATIEGLPPEPGDPPYKGLQFFTAADTELFFGREELTARLAGRLHDTNFLFIVGASGSGKSSLIRAGVIPALEGQEPLADGSLPPMGRWQTILLTPTERPLDSLATAFFPQREQLAERIELRSRLEVDDEALLKQVRTMSHADPTWRGLLVVDQFEELFTLCKAEETRRRFLAHVLTLIHKEELPLKTLLILRADFFAQCMDYEGLSPLLEQPTLIGAMSRQEMRAAILEPLAKGNWSIQEGLDQEILEEIGDEPGGLPLLSHALLETWRLRRGRTLTLSGYQEAGKVRGAIAKTAESLYTTRLTAAEQQALAKRLFLEMVEPGANERDTRRRITLEQLHIEDEQAADVHELLDTLVSARLVTADRRTGDQSETYEVAHEALIRNWDRLRDWLDDEREQIRFRRQLQRDAQEWDDEGRKSDFLYRGSKLARIEEQEGEIDAELDPLSREFVTVSIAQEKRRKRLRNASLVTAIVVAVVMVGLAILAFTFGQSAQQQREMAEENAQAAVANAREADANAQIARTNEQEAIRQRRGARTQALSAQSLEIQRNDPQLAALLALQAAQLNQPGELSASWLVDRALRSALDPKDTRFNQVLTHTATIERVQFSPDGNRLYVLGDDKQIVTWNAKNLERLSDSPPEPGPGFNVISGFCHDDSLAVVQEQGSLSLWDAQQETLTPFAAPSETLFWTDVARSSDGQWIAAAADTGPIYMWDSASPAEPPLALHSPDDSFAWALAYLPGSNDLVAAGSGGTLWQWSAADYEADPVPLIELEDQDWRDVAAAAAGRWLAAANDDGSVYLWDLQDPAGEGAVIGAHSSGARAVAISEDGRYIASGGGDGQIQLWEMPESEAGTVISNTLPGHDQDIRTLAFSCAGDSLASGAGDRSIRLWSLVESPAAAQRAQVPASGAPERFNREVTGLHFRGGDQQLISASRDGQIWAWDWQTKPAEPTLLTPDQENPGTIRTDDQGQRVATVSDDGVFEVKPSTGGMPDLQAELVTSTEPQKGPVPAISADGQRAAVSSGVDNTQILFWDMAQGVEEQLVGEHDDNINQLLFAPDGRSLISASDDGTVRVWPLENDGSSPAILPGHTNTVESLAISAAGLLAASGDSDNVVLIWDLREPRETPQKITRHEATISALAFSEDGRWLASGDDGGRLFIWELDNLAEPAQLTVPEPANISSLAFAPDGSDLASGMGFTGEINLWPTLEELVRLGCRAAGRNLTWAEWQRYVPDEPYCPVCPEYSAHQTAIEAGVYDPASCP